MPIHQGCTSFFQLSPPFLDLPDFALTQLSFQPPHHHPLSLSLSLLLATRSKFATQYNGTVISNVISTMEMEQKRSSPFTIVPHLHALQYRCSYEAGGLKVIKKIRGRKGVAEKIIRILSSFRNRLENFVARISFPPR